MVRLRQKENLISTYVRAVSRVPKPTDEITAMLKPYRPYQWGQKSQMKSILNEKSIRYTQIYQHTLKCCIGDRARARKGIAFVPAAITSCGFVNICPFNCVKPYVFSSFGRKRQLERKETKKGIERGDRVLAIVCFR